MIIAMFLCREFIIICGEWMMIVMLNSIVVVVVVVVVVLVVSHWLN